MPAAAVIPAPKAYVQIAAVKKLVVGGVAWPGAPPAARRGRARLGLPSSGGVPRGAGAARRLRVGGTRAATDYFEQTRVFKAGIAL